MRRTTTSLATFCSLLSLALCGAACGKRGDPLPPLRPVPGTAEGVVVRQVGDRIRLEWTAPVRNTDGTTEKIALREARVLRRVLDIEALVEEQTVPVEPEPSPEAGEQAPPELAVLEGAEVSEPGEPVADVEAAPGVETPPAVAETEGAPSEDTAAELEAPAPASLERPALRIPPFGGGIVATLDSEVLGARLFYEETVEPSLIGKRVEYAVVYVNRSSRQSPLSTVAQIEPREPLSAPGDVAAEAGDGFVRVTWRPPPDAVPGTLVYAVYRRVESASALPDLPLGKGPVRSLSYRDETVVFGQSFCYAVQTIYRPMPPPATDEAASSEEVLSTSAEEPEVLVPIVPPIAGLDRVRSPISKDVCLTPLDRFPPPAPSDLVAVPSAEGVLLTWREVEAPDLAGYRVYRSDRPDGDFELLAEATGGSYTDAAAPAERTSYYVVTAIDDAPAVNESARTNVAEAERP